MVERRCSIGCIMSADDEGNEPVAGLSAASACLVFSSSVSGSEEPAYRPVFTHQIFDGEFIPGWRPLQSAEAESKDIYAKWKSDGNSRVLHSSYENITNNSAAVAINRIEIRADIAPSCEECMVMIKTEREPATKRRKVVSFGADDGNSIEEAAPMPIEEIIRRISKALPPLSAIKVNGQDQSDLLRDLLSHGSSFEASKDVSRVYLQSPVGKDIYTYLRGIKWQGTISRHGSLELPKFVLSMADGSDEGVADFHNKVQGLARWFIESADGIDLTDTSNGRWKVVYLFRNHNSTQENGPLLEFVGYATLLAVTSPFRKPKPGTILRICQVVIRPPYHRAGHGSTILQQIHNYANSTQGCEQIVEVNVEDPAPSYQIMRNGVDYGRFVALRAGAKSQPYQSQSLQETAALQNFSYVEKYDVTEKEYYTVSDEDLWAVAEQLKITKRQSHIVLEISKLAEIERWKKQQTSTTEGTSFREVETNYRLMIKKSLRQYRLEELGACEGGKDGQKALLGQWFEETIAQYRKILKSEQ